MNEKSQDNERSYPKERGRTLGITKEVIGRLKKQENRKTVDRRKIQPVLPSLEPWWEGEAEATTTR
jgi:hypothetical protein